jgi:hypothetical protein
MPRQLRSSRARAVLARRRPKLQAAANPAVTEAVLEVVDNQLRDNSPPETRQTLDRLVAEGHSTEYARRLIAFVVLVEMNDMLRERHEFDLARYVAALRRLPSVS